MPLINNVIFTAAGIAFSQRKYEEFNDPHDTRLKTWFIVDKEKLYSVSNLEDYLPKDK